MTLPITILALGICLFVINVLILLVVPHCLVVWGSLVVSITSWFASWSIGSRGKFEF